MTKSNDFLRKGYILVPNPSVPLDYRDYKLVPVFYSKDVYISDHYNIRTNDKIYIKSGSAFPRVKYNSLTKNHNIKITRDINKANAIFVNEKNLFPGFRREWLACTNYGEIKNLGNPTNLSEITVNDSTPIFVNSNFTWHFYRVNKTLFSSGFSDKMDHYDILMESSSDYQYYSELYNSPLPVYSDIDLLELIDNEVVIDREKYEVLYDMLKSNDVSNHTIAVEIMANCNYRLSSVFVLTLIRIFYNQIINTRASRHVNFKALLSYYGIQITSMTTYDSILKVLEKIHMINNETIGYLKPLIKDYLQSINPNTTFRVSDITFSDSIMETLKQEEELLSELKRDELEVTC